MKRFLKKIIPLKLVHFIYLVKLEFNFFAIRFFSLNRFTASLYYFLFSSEFKREQLSVLKGRVEYRKSLDSIGVSSALLRRNIHRLEKGLIMRPRKSVFAEAYIVETVECFLRASKRNDFCNDEIKWAHDVLFEYFSSVSHEGKIAKAYEILKTSITESYENNNCKPYLRSDSAKSDISYEALDLLFKQRRSVRWYQNKHVPLELIHKAVESATFAPSACNRQPFEFQVTNVPAKAVAIANCAMGTTGFATNLQAIIVIVGDLSAYPAERDRHVIYIDGSLAAMQLMLSLETLGLASCPINWPDVEERELELDALLNLSKFKRPMMLLAVGYPDATGGIPYSQKKNSKMLVKEI